VSEGPLPNDPFAEQSAVDGPAPAEAVDGAPEVSEPSPDTQHPAPDTPDEAPHAQDEAADTPAEAERALELEDDPEPEPIEDMPDPSEDLALHLLDVGVRLWAELGRSELPLGQAVALGAGAIVDLDKEPDDDLDVFVNGLPFAKGKLILVDGEWAIRLERIVATPALVEQASSSGSGA
jgi:flagellar motor switch protein FliN